MHTRLSSLPQNASELVGDSLAWMDARWDDPAAMLRLDSYWHDVPPKELHHVRETCYYALALLLRGDTGKAVRAIDSVLKCQFDVPGAPFHGTWLRHPEEPMPGADAEEWRDYDPNWREFIGTGLMLMLVHFENELPSALVARIDAAIRLACIGSIARNIHADYTNIALMNAFLLDFAGSRYGLPGWTGRAEKLADEIHTLFRKHGTFPEYNSPTYYGVDLYALALWRACAPNEKLRAWGNEMEHTLWRDIARHYHAGMRNMAGPFDRSYGMDMCRYLAAAAHSFRLVLDRNLAPFPDTTKPFNHSHDLCFASVIALPGANVPPDAMPHLMKFQGARQIASTINESRTTTTWIDERLMLGGQWTCGHAHAWNQFHPATAHWKNGGEIHWMRIETFGPINVRVEQTQMSISVPARPAGTKGPAFRWFIHSPGAKAESFNPGAWNLPGLRIRIESENIATSNAVPHENIFAIDYTPSPEKTGSISMTFEVA